ncbi:MAG: transglutaminase domain-containing protein [Cyclobacteriaceae bacterium]
MKSLKILSFLLLLTTNAWSQEVKNIPNPKYKTAPISVSRSPIKLAEYLTSGDTSKLQQALNIYYWIVNNIEYDVKALLKVKQKSYTPKQTLRRKKELCYQYSELLSTLCENVGISTKEIMGYSRGAMYQEGDRFFESDHSWNGIKIDSTWHLVDATWGSGGLIPKNQWFKQLLNQWFNKPFINNKYKFIQKPDFKYFLISPDKLIQDHLPADPNWQLVRFPISIKTFESNQWEKYISRPDSTYKKEVDSLSYLTRLDKYEYLSALQYLRTTAEKSNTFNQKNMRLLGFSSFHLANSYERTIGDTETQLEAKSEALNLYKQAISQLRAHQRFASSESNKTKREIRTRISTELKKPTSIRISRTKQDEKEVNSFLSKYEKRVKGHRYQIKKHEALSLRSQGLYQQPDATRFERRDLVKNNMLVIAKNRSQLICLQDTAILISRNLKKLTLEKRSLQNQTLQQYSILPALSELNSNLIRDNHGITIISQSMHMFDSIGSIIDSLTTRNRTLEQEIRQHHMTIRQLQSSILAQAGEIKKLVIQNCQFSNNEACERSKFYESNEYIDFAYNLRLETERALIESIDHDYDISLSLTETIDDLRKLIETQNGMVDLFETKRLANTDFKLIRSNYQTNEIIQSSNRRIRDLNTQISRLKMDIRKKN